MRPKDFWEASKAIQEAEESGFGLLDQQGFDSLLSAAKWLYGALLNSLLTKHCRDVVEVDSFEDEEEEGDSDCP